VLAFVALAAYFQAAGATQLFGAALASPSSSVLGAKAPPAPIAVSHHPSADAIIDRNPFDSVTGPLNASVVPTGPSPTAKTLDINTDPLAAPACDSPQVFIVTESTDPLWSVAALQAPGDPRPRMHRVGDDVAGKHIEFIGFNPLENTPSVWFSSGGTLCQTMLFRTQPPLAASGAAPAAAVAAPPAPAGGPSPVPADIASKIQKVSDTEFNIDRSVVDKILENQAELMKSARIVPETKDGKVLGIRLFGIRPDTLLGTLGLQNGDRLEAINGFNMGSPEKALEAYARLRTASNLNVNVNRRGSPVAINFNIK
jgi:general secretion pathway protein C